MTAISLNTTFFQLEATLGTKTKTKRYKGGVTEVTTSLTQQKAKENRKQK